MQDAHARTLVSEQLRVAVGEGHAHRLQLRILARHPLVPLPHLRLHPPRALFELHLGDFQLRLFLHHQALQLARVVGQLCACVNT